MLDCSSFWNKKLLCFLTVEIVEMPGLHVAFGGKRKSRVATVPAMLVNLNVHVHTFPSLRLSSGKLLTYISIFSYILYILHTYC